MISAIRKNYRLLIVGITISLLLGLLIFWVEKLDQQRRAEVFADNQLDRIADRLTNARAEIDAASVFIGQAPTALRQFGDFVGRLSLTHAKLANWLVIASLDADKKDQALAQIRAALGDSKFEFLPSDGPATKLLYVVQTVGVWQTPLAGHQLAEIPDIGAELLPAQRPNGHESVVEAGVFVTKSALFPDKIAWVFQSINAAQNDNIDLPQLFVVRGFNIERLKADASLDPRQKFTLTASVGGRTQELAGLLPSDDQSQVMERRTVIAEPFKFNIGLSPPPGPNFPRSWILAVLIGLAGTSLAFSWRIGQQALITADTLVGKLRETRNALDVTRDREATFFENSGTANCETDVKTGRIVRVNHAMCELFGYSAEELVGKTSAEITHPADLGLTMAVLNEVRENADWARQFEKRYVKSDGSEFWGLVQTKMFGSTNSENALYLNTIIDISERKAMEITKNNLVRELAHRVRNTMQLTASMARQTAKSVRNVDEYDLKFRQRLAALSAAQDVLFDAAWHGADLSFLAKRTLAPFESERLQVDIGSLHLPTQHAQTFAIALHELAANSMTFGALGSGGHTMFTSEILQATESEPTRLHLTWHETGIQSKSRSRRHGFGHMMLFKVLPEQFGGYAKDERILKTYTYQCWLNLPITQ